MGVMPVLAADQNDQGQNQNGLEISYNQRFPLDTSTLSNADPEGFVPIGYLIGPVYIADAKVLGVFGVNIAVSEEDVGVYTATAHLTFKGLVEIRGTYTAGSSTWDWDVALNVKNLNIIGNAEVFTDPLYLQELFVGVKANIKVTVTITSPDDTVTTFNAMVNAHLILKVQGNTLQFVKAWYGGEKVLDYTPEDV